MVTLENVAKVYRTRHGQLKALEDINLQIGQGEFVVVRGPSGSGKTTLLMILGAMLRPSRGTVVFDRTDVYGLNVSARARFRAENIGFIFQMFYLVPYLTVLENVLLARMRSGNGPDDRTKAAQLLQELGLGDRMFHRPAQLSAGEKQRTAIARALLNAPRVLLADEPTGNLDPENAAEVMEHLRNFQADGGTVILATHADLAGKFAGRTVTLAKGAVENVRNF